MGGRIEKTPVAVWLSVDRDAVVGNPFRIGRSVRHRSG